MLSLTFRITRGVKSSRGVHGAAVQFDQQVVSLITDSMPNGALLVCELDGRPIV